MWTRLRTWVARLGSLLADRRADRDLRDELALHLDLLTEEHVRRGIEPGEARRLAHLRLGGVAQIAEDHRDRRAIPLVETTLQDLRYGFRVLRRQPAHAAAVILTLAVGIGAGTAIFVVADAVLLRPLPYADPGSLVRIFETNPLKGWTRNIAAPANYADWKSQNQAFTDMAAYEQYTSVGSGGVDAFLTGFGEPQPVKTLGVTGNLFRVLGAPPLIGRTFTDRETFEGPTPVVVLSYGLWQSAFAGDPSIVGRTITLSGRSCEVIAVMPRGFFFPGRDIEIWRPVAYPPDVFATRRRAHWLGVVGRLRPGVSLEAAQANMNAIASALERQYPDTNTRMGVRLEFLHDSLAAGQRPALLMLSAAVALLFALVCANIASLQLARGLARGRELAVRRAMGAARRRLLRQLLTESALVSAAGGALGFVFAVGARAAMLRFASATVPLYADLRLDWTALAFAVAVSITAPMWFAVIPALVSFRAANLREHSTSPSRDSRRLRHALVAAEVGLSVALVVGAIFLVRSLARVESLDPGFQPDSLVAFTVTLPSSRYADPAARFLAFSNIERRLREIPGIDAVGASSSLPLRSYTWTGDATVEGRAPDDYERELRHESVTPGYFAALGTPLVAGRMLDDRDRRGQPLVTLVNQALVTQYFHGADAVGKRIKFARPADDDPWVTIVGVVADQKQDGMRDPVRPEAYAPIAQQIQNPLTFVLRTAMDPSAAVAAARRRVAVVDKDLALTDVATARGIVDAAMAGERFRTIVLALFAAVALGLAALGVYGVLSYSVTQRSRELGIRLALGARPDELFRLVLGQGMRPVVAGAVAGLGLAVVAVRLGQSLLFGLSTGSAGAYAAGVALVLLVALAACALPARGASGANAIDVLRADG